MDKKYEIWLAEDDLDDFELFKEVLISSSKQFAILHFATGVELWNSLSDRKKKYDKSLPDLIVLDQFMPQKSGWDILELIKEDPENAFHVSRCCSRIFVASASMFINLNYLSFNKMISCN